jgi:hypothetical protein
MNRFHVVIVDRRGEINGVLAPTDWVTALRSSTILNNLAGLRVSSVRLTSPALRALRQVLEGKAVETSPGTFDLCDQPSAASPDSAASADDTILE